MKREYINLHSSILGRNMEMLIFGDKGTRVLFFPTRKARFFDYENWGVMDALKTKINAGYIQVICIDSIDYESFYNNNCLQGDKINRHLLFEKHIIEEIIPLTAYKNPGSLVISAGCSLGAYHAMNISLRYPHLFTKVVGMSGRYDLIHRIGTFKDLFNGYVNKEIVENMPSLYMPFLEDDTRLEQIKKLEIIIAIGEEDAFLANNDHFHYTLDMKNIHHEYRIWKNEAHNPIEWREMVQFYL